MVKYMRGNFRSFFLHLNTMKEASVETITIDRKDRAATFREERVRRTQ